MIRNLICNSYLTEFDSWEKTIRDTDSIIKPYSYNQRSWRTVHPTHDRLDLDQGSVNILNALDMAQAPFSGSSYNYLNVAETWSNIRKFNRFIKSLESSIVALKCLSSSVALDNTFKILQDDPIRYFLSSPLYPIFRLDNNANTWDSRDTLG